MNSLDTTNSKFDTLDALRFFAFFRIFLLHIPDFFNIPFFDKIKNGGGIGVDFFFVLSGFLITYLLAKEKSTTGAVNAKRFMMRRIFRIWPLYYLGVCMAYANVTISRHYAFGINSGYMPNILFSATFTENIKMIIEDNFPNGAPLRVFWSLCVEEQFYILWIILFKTIKFKHLSKVLVLLIAAAWCYRIISPSFLHNTMMTDLDLISKLDYFCIGGLLALYIVTDAANVKKLQSFFIPRIQLPIICLCFFFFYFVQILPNSIINNPVYFPTLSATIFTVLIACFILPSAKYRIPNNSFIGKWGNISYGLYVYHTPVILVLMVLFKALHWQTSWFSLTVFILFSFFITLIISYLSYKFIEKPFLNLRNKYFFK